MNKPSGITIKLNLEQLKAECTPRSQPERDETKKCKTPAPEGMVDDWGDSCAGYKCCLPTGHTGRHMASDGANGWIYF